MKKIIAFIMQYGLIYIQNIIFNSELNIYWNLIIFFDIYNIAYQL